MLAGADYPEPALDDPLGEEGVRHLVERRLVGEIEAVLLRGHLASLDSPLGNERLPR
jgi:hypothetical protein